MALCTHTHKYTHTHTHTHACRCQGASLGAVSDTGLLCVYVCLCLCIYVCLCLCMDTHTNIEDLSPDAAPNDVLYVRMCVCVCVCV